MRDRWLEGQRVQIFERIPCCSMTEHSSSGFPLLPSFRVAELRLAGMPGVGGVEPLQRNPCKTRSGEACFVLTQVGGLMRSRRKGSAHGKAADAMNGSVHDLVDGLRVFLGA